MRNEIWKEERDVKKEVCRYRNSEGGRIKNDWEIDDGE